jgi:predicted 3-demethylubiquinone-9 3-methyltransferase (glyoxalase superfamily)
LNATGHDWDFSPAMSIWVACASSYEQQHLFDALSADGGVAHMPVGDYGFGPFGWVQDRFGVNWQLAV